MQRRRTVKNSLAPEISDESCVIVGLLHDFAKCRQLEQFCFRKIIQSVIKYAKKFEVMSMAEKFFPKNIWMH